MLGKAPSHLIISAKNNTYEFPRGFLVTEIFLHEDFDHTSRLNDIALIKTSKFVSSKECKILLMHRELTFETENGATL